jgi:5,10-methylenetetrahydromethanopterin reductase
MNFGIGIATSGGSWRLAQRAEELAFTHASFFDTQMITGDCFVAMAAAALKTSCIGPSKTGRASSARSRRPREATV